MPCYDEEDSPADVAIVGLGPGGLAAALELAKQGKNVIAFNDREQYIRGQRLKLSKETRQFLAKHFDKTSLQDLEFREKYNEEGTIQTKDIEKYLYRKLQKYPNVTIIPALKDNNSAITSLEQGPEGNADCIKLRNGKKYYFRNLLGADGVGHSTANLVERIFGQSIDYKEADFQVRHPYHAVVQLQLKSGETRSTLKKEPNIVKEMRNFEQQGWKEPYLPKNYIFTNADCTKFYFAGEIPQQIFDAPETQQADLLKNWASLSLKKYYGVRTEQLEYRHSPKTPAKDKIQVTVFKMPITICQKPVVDLSNGVFAQIGDARRTPNYNLAHGVNDAVAGALIFAQAMSSGSFEKDIFEPAIQTMDESIEKKMKSSKQIRDYIKEKAQRKFLTSLDQFILLLQKDPKANQQAISKLQYAKSTFETTGELTTMYDALNNIKTIIEDNQRININYWAYSLINYEAKRQSIGFEQVATDLECYLRETIPLGGF